MKSNSSIITVVGLMGLFGLGYLTFRPTAAAKTNGPPVAQANDSRNCSVHTLKGAYGIKFEGRKTTGELIASVARLSFDGNGLFTTREIGRFNGVEFERTFTGPYVVNDDCTGYPTSFANPRRTGYVTL